MKIILPIQLNARSIGALLVMLNAVTKCAEIEDTIAKSCKILSGGQYFVLVDRGSIALKTFGASLDRGDVEGDAGFSRPLVDTPS